jgi:hypothetical protein
MTDADLQAVRTRLKTGEYDGTDIMRAWIAIDELLLARKDAERYRWLRNDQNWPAVFSSHDAPEPLRKDELDAAIDAAMKDKP